jgi:arsenate reductase
VTTLYHYPNCDTSRKARRWLKDHDVEFQLVDIVAAPPSQNKLKQLHAASKLPIAKLFNVSGQSYRAGNFKDKLKGMSKAQALAALAADGKLIKRPILELEDIVLVGFSEASYTDSM